MERSSHDYLGDRHDEHGRRTMIVVAITTVAMVAEVAGGLLTGSMALLADGFHMATDAGALAVAAAAYAFARRHVANRAFSFGTGKVGDLAGFASAMVLGLAALAIGWESAMRLVEPSPIAFAEAAAVAAIGLAVNLACAWLLGGGHHGHAHGPEDHGHDHDHNLRAAYLHVVADALTSVLAIAALMAGHWLGWAWADAAVGVLGALVILRWSWSLLRETAAVLLDTADLAAEQEIRRLVEGVDARIVDIHVWRVGPSARAAIVSVEGRLDRAAVLARLAPVAGLEHVTIECRGASPA